MRDCVNVEVRDALPDLLHGRLPAEERARVLAHVAGCADCAAELALLRGAREAVAVASPPLDAAAIARAVRARLAAGEGQPSAPPAPALAPRWAGDRRGARPRWAAWSGARLRAAAALAIVALGAGGIWLARRGPEPGAGPGGDTLALAPATAGGPGGAAPSAVPPGSAAADPGADVPDAAAAAAPRADLALGSTFADLSDAELAAIVDAVTGAEAALPAPEPLAPPPVVIVDSTEGL